MTASLLVIDNYDSFTFNLVQMFRQYDLHVSVVRADKTSVGEVMAQRPDYIVVSPGPKDPKAAGISVELILEAYRTIPILGVCLGLQCINEAFGGRTVRAPLPMHGKTSLIHHKQQGLLRNVPSPFLVARYHSLALADVHSSFDILATTSDGVVMALQHRESSLQGVQFHPESFLTEHGFQIVENFLRTGALGESAGR